MYDRVFKKNKWFYNYNEYKYKRNVSLITNDNICSENQTAYLIKSEAIILKLFFKDKINQGPV